MSIQLMTLLWIYSLHKDSICSCCWCFDIWTMIAKVQIF